VGKLKTEKARPKVTGLADAKVMFTRKGLRILGRGQLERLCWGLYRRCILGAQSSRTATIGSRHLP